MSHQLVAVAWDQLRGRHDVADILHEIVGQHASDLALLQVQDELFGNVEPLIRIVSWIKVVFDLQRAYVPSRPGSEDAHPYSTASVVPSEMVFCTMMYLIQIKARIFPTNTVTVHELSKYRYQIAQVLLSGLRVLLLRNEYIGLEKKLNLKKALSRAWANSNLPEEERFLVFDLLPAAIDFLRSVETHDNGRPHFDSSQADSPVFMGLHFLHMPPEHFVPEAFARLAHDGPERLGSFWMLFDTLWAAETALVQCQAELNVDEEEARASQRAERAREMLAHVEATRRSLFGAIFESSQLLPSTIPKGVLESLTATLLGWSTQADTAATARPRLYGKHLINMRQPFEDAVGSFFQWLSNRRFRFWDCNGESAAFHWEIRRSLKSWIRGTSAATNEDEPQESEEDLAPVYIVNCPSLHPVSQKVLAEVLRWSSKSTLEELHGTKTFLSMNAYCPRCAGDVPIKWARLIEPLEDISGMLQERSLDSNDSSSRYSTYSSRVFSSSGHLPRSLNRSNSTSLTSRVGSTEPYIAPLVPLPLSEARSRAFIGTVPITPASPLAPSHTFSDTPVSPIQAPMSMRRPSPPPPPSPPSLPSPVPPRSITIHEPPQRETRSQPEFRSPGKSRSQKENRLQKDFRAQKEFKPPSGSMSRKTNAFKERLSSKQTPNIPRHLSSCFSASGRTLLLWSDEISSVLRFDLSVTKGSVDSCCRYDAPGVELAAAGNQLCAVIASGPKGRKLYVFYGMDEEPDAEISIEPSRNVPGVCLAVSRDDKYVAFTLNDEVRVYQPRSGILRRIILQDQAQAYRGPSQQKAAHSSLQAAGKKPLSWKEIEQESQRKHAVTDRKLQFSSSAEELAIATHLADHFVHIDVWDCRSEPWTTRPENSRSFPFPPWTTNDGDITCVFYDSAHHSAILTAYLAREYPVLIPIPGYDELRTEGWCTKIVQAAQGPSGSRFIAVSGMNDVYLVDRKTDGTLNHRRMKRFASKISSSAFKPGQIALAMPLENLFLAFWVKDSKQRQLRAIMVDETETLREIDLQSEYHSLIHDQRPSIRTLSAQGSRTHATELPSPRMPVELPTPTTAPAELESVPVQELPGYRKR